MLNARIAELRREILYWQECANASHKVGAYTERDYAMHRKSIAERELEEIMHAMQK